MKYPIFVLSVCLILLTCACGQSGDASGESTDGGASGGNEPNIVVSNVRPSSEPNKLNEQVATDLLAAYALERTILPAYNESFELMTSVRPYLQAADDAGRERLKLLVADAIKIRNSYDEHKLYSNRLDSLTFKIASGKLSVEDAQKQYLEARNSLKSIESRISTELELLKKAKETLQSEYPSGNKAQ
ncbi:MAG: hypothetical protein IT261_06490 [Saprospiraceae bacterium]|nr:hypothetical protein [Saprospiraceae bacterium]